MTKHIIDLKIGDKYNRLTILREAGRKNSHRMYDCICECGNELPVRGSSLKSGNTMSCGCYDKEVRIQNLDAGRLKKMNGATENGKKTQEYEAFIHMKERCYNPKVDRYPNYGGRGIIVCESWLNSFANFLSDMGRKPSPEHSLERINVHLNYEPSNCKWGTQEEQDANRQNTIRLTVNGVEVHQAKLARVLNVGPKSIEYHRKKGKTGDELFEYFKNRKCS